MAVEQTIYTEQPAISPSALRDLAEQRDLAIRFLDLDGLPLNANMTLDEPMSNDGFVLIGWPMADTATTQTVDRALAEGDKPTIDRLGKAETLCWCSISCGVFDLAEFEAMVAEIDDEPGPALDVERMRKVCTEYAFRCGTKPGHAGFQAKIAEILREATNGFEDE